MSEANKDERRPMSFEKLKDSALPLTTSTIGAVVAVLLVLGLFGPARDTERLATEARITRLEAQQLATQASMSQMNHDIKEQLQFIRSDIRELNRTIQRVQSSP